MRKPFLKYWYKLVFSIFLATTGCYSITVNAENVMESNALNAKVDIILINQNMDLDVFLDKYKMDKSLLIQLNGGDLPDVLVSGTRIAIPSEIKIPELANLGSSNREISVIEKEVTSLLSGTLIEPTGQTGQTLATTTTSLLNAQKSGTQPAELATNQIQIIENNAKAALNTTASQSINQAANHFLGRFGTAEVNITIEDGKVANTDLSVFSPVFDDKTNHLFFAQNAIRRQGTDDDKRLVGNFGLGYRYNTPDYLLGANAFIDHDFTGENTRFGLGSEFWMNYSKLSANLYAPISNWKSSETLIGYDERPARGIDIRYQGYLPSYPHIGGSLTFEQYFGDEVALFGYKERQSDPYALTAGIDYTPVPLITLGASHRVGENGNSDTRVDLKMNLRMGIPLDQQLDPNNVITSRQLMGSRYDLVDRNNEIVFEYRKQKFDVSIIPTMYLNAPNLDSYLFGVKELIEIQSKHNSQAEITSFNWRISPTQPQKYSSVSTMSFESLTPGIYYVQLVLTNEIGATATSNVLTIKVEQPANLGQVKIDFINRTGDVPTYDFNQDKIIDYGKSSMDIDTAPDRGKLFNAPDEIPSSVMAIDKLGMTFIHFTVTSQDKLGNPVDLRGVPPKVMYKIDEAYQLLDASSEYVKLVDDYHDETQQNVWHFIVASGNPSLDKKEIEFYATAFTGNGEGTSATAKMMFFKDNVDKPLTPASYRIVMTDFGKTGQVEGDIVLDTASGVQLAIKQDNYYQVQVYENTNISTQSTIPSAATWRDITAEVQNSLVWRYYNPENQEDISVKVDEYNGLEACRGYTRFSTQVNNFINNEMAWGELGETYINESLVESAYVKGIDILTEQNLLLAVQFDKSKRDTSQTKIDSNKVICSDKVPASAEYYNLMVDISQKPVIKGF